MSEHGLERSAADPRPDHAAEERDRQWEEHLEFRHREWDDTVWDYRAGEQARDLADVSRKARKEAA